MAAGAEVNRFYKQVIEPLFKGEALYPYSVIFPEWAHYRSFLAEVGIPEYQIPVLTASARRQSDHVKIAEIDFLIQVIVADVLHQISEFMVQSRVRYLQDTEAHAVKLFLALADQYFPIVEGGSDRRTAIYDVNGFEQLKDNIEGAHAQLLNWACRRLNFFYKVQIQKERRHREERRRQIEQPVKQAAPASVEKASLNAEASTGVVLKEQFVDRLYTAVAKHPLLQEMVDTVNRKRKDPGDDLGIEIDHEGKGVFSIGRSQVDLRGILARIFVAIKPQAELLLSFLISKIQPDKVNLIELHYEDGLAEFEVGIMLEEGGISKQVHGAISECTAKTTFPKIVVVCAAILEEVLGAKVNISFNRKGEVVVELPEMRERSSKNIAVALRKKLEEAIHKEEIASAGKLDPEYEELKRIGAGFEAEALSPTPSYDVYLPDKYDQMIEADLMRAAVEIQQKEAGAVITGKPDKPKKYADLEEQFRQFQQAIATDDQTRIATELSQSTHTQAIDTAGRESTAQPSPQQGSEASAKADEDNAKLNKLEESFRRTKPSKSIEEFTESLLSGKDSRLPDLDTDLHESMLTVGNKAYRTEIESRPLLFEARSHFYRAPRDVTMAILAGVRSKHVEQSRRWDDRSRKRSEVQMAQNFLDVLDEVALECCGAHLETLFPELIGADNFFEIARKLNAISDRQQHRQSDDESFEILLSGAIMASSSIQLTT